MEPLSDGIYTALLTPFTEAGEIDESLLVRLLAFQEAAGVQGVVIGGTTGEGASLSVSEKVALYELASRTRGQLRLIAGILNCSLPEAIELARNAARAGCDALMVAPPFYYRAPLDGLIAFYRALLEATELPVVLYNIPQLTRQPLPAVLVEALLPLSNLLGIKDSSGDPESLRTYLGFAPRLKVWVGEEKLLLRNLQSGGAGSISGLANVFPERLVATFRAFCEGREAEGLQQLIDEAADALDDFPAPANFKYALTLRGLPLSHVRLPLHDLSKSEQHALKKAVQPHL
ncbi:MAG: dihydrodipicolinate synthase family protein [Fimbriimonadales bacterium]|nr:dihydrodipicolinate synthase family protein [Fimbriimonadales bacterium]